jgi:hypothetical protein
VVIKKGISHICKIIGHWHSGVRGEERKSGNPKPKTLYETTPFITKM